MGIPKILAYHPQIFVDRGDARVVLKLSLPDWEEDEKILRSLAESYGVSTAGEVAEGVGFEVVDSVCEGARVWGWGERVNG